MTREDIIAWARDAGLIPGPSPTEALERFAALVAEAERDKWMDRAHTMILGEREACAKVCEDWTRTPATNGMELTLVAAAIRARGETK